MGQITSVAAKTVRTWLIDAVGAISGLLSIVSGIYFLYLPVNGYMGGRNPNYGVTVLVDRHIWEGLHTWASIVMIAAAVIHFALHLSWARMSAKRVAKHVSGSKTIGSRRVSFNIAINALLGLSFLICAVSGLYFLFFTVEGGFEGGANLAWDPGILFSRLTWDLIHTWSGVVMSAAIVVHFAIHWRWVTRVTANLAGIVGGKADTERSVQTIAQVQ